MNKTLIQNGTIVTQVGEEKTDILIDITKTIEKIAPKITEKKADVIDAKGMLIMPLLIDCHVHFREPGMEHKATMETESRAALAGGVGTVCEMPNTTPPVVTVAALADKVRRASLVNGKDLRFFFGVTEEAHLFTLRELWTGESMELKRLKRHCCGVKLYLDHSTGDQKVDGSIVDEIFKTCGELKIPLVAHCEDSDMNTAAKKLIDAKDPATLPADAHSLCRPPESEGKAIEYAIGLAKKHGTALHIAHLSTKDGLDLVRKAKKEKLSVTCEVAPHHLFLTDDDYKTLGTYAKMNPPLRSTEHRDALWEGVIDGTVDCIATDHAPHTIDEKKSGGQLTAPSGVPGVETMLPLMLSAVNDHWPHPTSPKPTHYPLPATRLLDLCFTKPNHIFSLHQQDIAATNTARIAIINPTEAWTLEAKKLHSKCGWTPFEGWKVQGRAIQVIQG